MSDLQRATEASILSAQAREEEERNIQEALRKSEARGSKEEDEQLTTALNLSARD
tara:strand:- start:239 stop:403 length:165 start_codon:yes stop_codon:yes gene_type:complete